MNVKDTLATRYLGAETDIEDDEDLILTIKECEMETLGEDKKLVLYFKETKKGLALNKTNMKTIAKVLDSMETDDWIGKRIALFSTEVDFKGEQVLAIRVRLKAPKAKPVEAAAPPADTSDPFSEDDD
mgnify:CR=1 FL=1